MRIVNPILAVQSRAKIKQKVSDHLASVCRGDVALESLDLTVYGIVLEPGDFSVARCARWTKKSMLEYREEAIVLAGLWRTISVRLNNKRRDQRLRELAKRVI